MIHPAMQAAMRGSKTVEDIGRAQQVARDSVRQHERQIEENERHLVGEIMHAVHDEAQTIGLESGNRFDHENRGVERGGGRERSAIMGHGYRPAGPGTGNYRRSPSRATGMFCDVQCRSINRVPGATPVRARGTVFLATRWGQTQA